MPPEYILLGYRKHYAPRVYSAKIQEALCPHLELGGGSLVPMPSYHSGFVCLQYAKTEGGRPGIFYHMDDVSVYLGRQGGSPIERMHFMHAFFVLTQEWYVFHSANVRNSSAWDINYKKRPQTRSFDQGPLPPLST